MKCRNCKNNSLREEDGEQFTWCEVAVDNLDIDRERCCSAFRQATKADLFWAMTDEELAEALNLIAVGQGPLPSDANRQEWLEWIKQEASSDAETKTTISDSGGDATDRTGDSQVDV